jgi:hypothetical protein
MEIQIKPEVFEKWPEIEQGYKLISDPAVVIYVERYNC